MVLPGLDKLLIKSYIYSLCTSCYARRLVNSFRAVVNPRRSAEFDAVWLILVYFINVFSLTAPATLLHVSLPPSLPRPRSTNLLARVHPFAAQRATQYK